MGSSTENSAFGPTHNPWDPTRVPGGSGGGSAAAVSAGLAPWALGSDTGGSIKQPAALCGNVGLRPTYGTVSRYGVVAFASSLDQVGPGREERARLRVPVLDHLGPRRERHDDRRRARGRAADRRGPEGPAHRRAEGDERGRRASSRASADAVRKARRAGRVARCATVGECSLPRSVDYGVACYYLIAPAEASSNLARYDGVRYGLRSDGDDFPRDGDGDAARRLRRRAEAPHHDRHVRALVRLLRRVLRHGAEGADDDPARARRGVRATST